MCLSAFPIKKTSSPFFFFTDQKVLQSFVLDAHPRHDDLSIYLDVTVYDVIVMAVPQGFYYLPHVVAEEEEKKYKNRSNARRKFV